MCRIFCHSCTVLIKEGGGARLTGSIHPALRRRKLEVGWVWEKAQTAGTFWSRRSDSEQPFSLEGRRLISLTAWGRAWGRGGLARYMGPWCINLCSWRGPHLVLWLILASWLPSSLQSTQWVGSGDRQAGRQHGGGSRQRERQLRPRTVSSLAQQAGLQVWRAPRYKPGAPSPFSALLPNQRHMLCLHV